MQTVINVSKICTARLEHGYSQTELAKLAGISYASINYLENKRTIPHPGNLKRICDVLGLSVSDVCTVKE